MSVAARQKDVFALWASGVAVVTAIDPEGSMAAFTASSLVSVSLEPPLFSFCLAATDPDIALYERAMGFGVVILGEDDQAISNHFATPAVDKLAGQAFEPGPARGAPILRAGVAWLEAEPHRVVDAGDHRLFLAKTVAGAPRDGGARGPLLYCGRGYARIARGEGA